MGAWRRILAWLPPGTRWLLAFCVAGWVLDATGLGGRLALIAPGVHHGQVWRLITYPWIPNATVDFLVNGCALAILGWALERRWNQRTLLSYTFVVVALTGVTWSVLPLSGSGAWHGGGPLLFGLLTAWGRLYADQTIGLISTLQVRASAAAMIFGGLSLLLTALTAGFANALLAALGAAWGLAYLWLRSRLSDATARPVAVSQRINRLEL